MAYIIRFFIKRTLKSIHAAPIPLSCHLLPFLLLRRHRAARRRFRSRSLHTLRPFSLPILLSLAFVIAVP